MPTYEIIETVETVNTGGGCMVDVVVLKDGRVLGITAEVVVLYESMEDFSDGFTEFNSAKEIVLL